MNDGDEDVLSQLSDLVETLTTSGSRNLDENLFKRVKSICKSSDENVRHLYRLVMMQLEKRHSEIRLSSLQIINEIFLRSHAFRVLLVDDFQKFLGLTIGVNSKKPLPEPKAAAAIVREQAFKAIDTWHDKYGPHYMKLALGYKYLKRVKKYNFEDSQPRTELEQLRAQDAQTRQASLAEQKLNTILTQMAEFLSEIQNAITEMGNCFRLLLPTPDEFDTYATTDQCDKSLLASETPSTSTKSNIVNQDKQGSSTVNKLSDHGLNSPLYQLDITVSPLVKIVETPDNIDVLNMLRELHKQVVDKYLPLTQKWLEVLTKHSGHQENLVQAIDLKNSLTELKYKFDKLRISQDGVSHGENSNDGTTEDDFVDVPEKEGLEHVSECNQKEYGLKLVKSTSLPSTKTGKDDASNTKTQSENIITWNPHGNTSTLGDPSSRVTAIAALLNKHERKASGGRVSKHVSSSTTSRPTMERKRSINSEASSSQETNKKRAELLKKAPVVPFGMDLYNWERKEEEAPSMSSVKSLHCFWTHADEDIDGHCPGDIKESMKSRSIRFAGEFEQIKWACRAPLPSGKLCPRKDRLKCPFHGKIIPRDATGRPEVVDSETNVDDDNTAESTRSRENDEITRDIEQATGMDLGVSKKEKRGKKRKQSGLTDLKKNSNTSRARLEKIVFNKAALERVGDEMDRVKKRLIDEKFGNNWNYALKP